MPALVPELVNAAIDASVSPGDLLRRALVVARRLAVPELVDWISSELNGYYSGAVDGRKPDSWPDPVFSTVQVQGVIEKVRSRVLEWALDLEAKGVLGEGMTFTQQEKQTVQQHYHFGDVSGSQIQIGSNSSNQTQTQTGGDMAALSALIELLRDAIQQGRIEAEVRDELQAELATLQAQAASPKPKWAVIKATAGSIKAVLENAAGSVLAAQALPYLTALL